MGALLFLFPAASQCLEEGLTPEWRPLSMVWALMGSCTWSSYSGAWPTAGLQKPWPIWMKKPYEEESPSRNCWVQQKNLYRKLGLHRFVSWIVPWVFVLFILIKLQFYVFWPKYVKARQLVAASKIQNYCSMIDLFFPFISDLLSLSDIWIFLSFFIFKFQYLTRFCLWANNFLSGR